MEGEVADGNWGGEGGLFVFDDVVVVVDADAGDRLDGDGENRLNGDWDGWDDRMADDRLERDVDGRLVVDSWGGGGWE